MIQTHAGRATGSHQYGGTRPPVSATAPAAEASSDKRNSRVPKPTHNPAHAPSTAHFSVLMRSAVCSVYQRLSSARRGGSGSASGTRIVLHLDASSVSSVLG